MLNALSRVFTRTSEGLSFCRVRSCVRACVRGRARAKSPSSSSSDKGGPAFWSEVLVKNPDPAAFREADEKLGWINRSSSIKSEVKDLLPDLSFLGVS